MDTQVTEDHSNQHHLTIAVGSPILKHAVSVGLRVPDGMLGPTHRQIITWVGLGELLGPTYPPTSCASLLAQDWCVT